MVVNTEERRGREGREEANPDAREIYDNGAGPSRRAPDQEKADHDSMTTGNLGTSHSEFSQSWRVNYREAVTVCGARVASGLLGF